MDAAVRSQLLSVLRRHPGVRLAIVFGSVAAGATRWESDLDIAVGTGEPMSVDARMSLIGDLAKATGRAVDLVDLASVGEPLLGEILARGTRILGSDEDYAALVYRHVIEKADFLPYRDRILAVRRRAWLGG